MGISIWQLLIVLAIIVLLFGTKKLRTIGGDLGGAIKGFRDSISDGDTDEAKLAVQHATSETVAKESTEQSNKVA